MDRIDRRPDDPRQSPSVFACFGARWYIVYDSDTAAWIAIHKRGTAEHVVAAHTEAELISKLTEADTERDRLDELADSYQPPESDQH